MGRGLPIIQTHGCPAFFVALLCVACIAGCAPIVPHDNQSPGIMQGPPKGLYEITAHVPGSGPFTGSTAGIFAIEPTRDSFHANTRPGAVGELVGGLEGVLVSLFGGLAYPGGTLVRWASPLPCEAAPVQGRLWSPRGQLSARLCSLDQPVELRAPGSDDLVGLLTVRPLNEGPRPARDYAAVADQVRDLLAARLFDPAMYQRPATQRYLAELHRVAGVARDDLEFVAGAMLAARRLEFSHLGLYRRMEPAYQSYFAERSSVSPFLTAEATKLSIDSGIATLRIAHFAGDPVKLDDAFQEIGRLAPRALIIDLRDNPGGSFQAARVAAHLIDQVMDAGVFFNAEARPQVLAGNLEAFPALDRIDSVEEFQTMLERHGAFRFRIIPAEPRFSGPVAVLINGRTASAAEPLVAGLQEAGRATLVGEPTAGAMLSSQHFDLADGWILAMPTADYLTPRGLRLEGRGVRPDIRASSAAAPAAATTWLRKHGQ